MGGVWSTWKQYGRVAISLLARSSYSMVSHHMVFFLQQLVFYLDFIWVQVCIKQKKKRNNEKLDLIVVFNHRCDFFLNFCGKIYSNSDHAADPEKKKHRGENFKGKICLFTFGLKKKKSLLSVGQNKAFFVFMYDNCALWKRLLFFRFHKRQRKKNRVEQNPSLLIWSRCAWVDLILHGCIRQKDSFQNPVIKTSHP